MNATRPPRKQSTGGRRRNARDRQRLDDSDPRGSARLQNGYEDSIRRHVLYLQAFDQTGATFVLRGYANLRTNEPNAVELSGRRANAVTNCLRDLGVPAGKIKVMANGSERAWDVDMGGRRPLKWNRRVEITIVLGRAGASQEPATRVETRSSRERSLVKVTRAKPVRRGSV